MTINNHIIKSTIYSVLSIAQFLVLGFSLIIYTSLNKNLPWHESCGMQFITIFIISVPVLIIIGLGLLTLNKSYPVKRINIMLPFYAALGLGLPILIDGSLSKITITIGTILCVALIIFTIALPIVHFRLSISKE